MSAAINRGDVMRIRRDACDAMRAQWRAEGNLERAREIGAWMARVERARVQQRFRLPIYGERDVDAALRNAVDDFGYGRWLFETSPDLYAELDPLIDVHGACVVDVDEVLWSTGFTIDGDRWDLREHEDDCENSFCAGCFDADEEDDDEDEVARGGHLAARMRWLRICVAKMLNRNVGSADALTHREHCVGEAQEIDPWPETPGVYAVEGAPGWVKIGKAKNIRKRVGDLQVAHPVKLRLLAVLSDNPADENAFHRSWKQWRTHGEWFELSREIREALRLSATQREGKRAR